MPKKIRTHREVGEDYLQAASSKNVVRHRFACSPQQLWNALLDAKAWTEWLPIEELEWTSKKPFGVGTTRTVAFGKEVIHEEFFAWEEGKRMAFCFSSSTLPVRAAVEDYRVEETESGCELVWTYRVSAFLPLQWIFNRILKSGVASGVGKLEQLILSSQKRFQK